MIKSITMRDCATYNDMGVTLDNCTKVNFIYGANGSGKSTIGNFLSNPLDSMFSNCTVEFDSDVSSDILVYNRNFREIHIAKNDIPGVFTLGRSAKEDLEKMENLKSVRTSRIVELNKTYDTLNKKKSEQATLREKFKETIWKQILKKYQSEFYEAFKSYHSSKDKFYLRVIDRFRSGVQTPQSLENLRSRAKSLFGDNITNRNLLKIVKEDMIEYIDDIEKNPIWSKVIIGNDDVPIAKLIKKLDNADWVSKGRNFLADDVCPFCQQRTISDKFRLQIEKFFGGEYTRDTDLIGKLKGDYKTFSDDIINLLDEIIYDVSAVAVSGIDIDKYKSIVEVVSAKIRNNCTKIENKISEPSRKITLELIRPELEEILNILTEGNQKITEHNRVVANLQSEKNKLVNEFWIFFIEEQRALISTYWNEHNTLSKSIDGIESKCKSLKTGISELDKEIVEAEKNVTSVQPTIDEINRSLKSYGFSGFKIVPSPIQKNYYQIQREDGTLVNTTLSEGEETFISFLYFMQMSKGANNVSKLSSKRIMVIDDPICSLDSTVLFIVSVILKRLIDKISKNESDVEQLFILTHNVYFHRETSYINGRPEKRSWVNFWILRKENNISILKDYKTVNPINSSYDLLWREIREDSDNSFITIQNVMRRILENYFSLLGNKKDDFLIKSFNSIEEQMICESLLTWVNDGSHTIADDLFVDSHSDIIQKYKNVFHQIFINTGNEAHYNMMMKI